MSNWDRSKKINEILGKINGSEEDRIARFKKTYSVTDARYEERKADYANYIAPINVTVTDHEPGVPNYSYFVQTVTVGRPGSIVLQFNLMNYPSCCGAKLLHSFMANVPPEQEEVYGQLLTEILKGFSEQMFFKNRRIITVMVETGRKPKDALNIEPSIIPSIQYDFFWKYWHKNAAKITDRLMWNCNSYHILHELEVVLK